MPLPCPKPRVSVDRASDHVYVWSDSEGNCVGLLRDKFGNWSPDILTPDDLKDYWEPVYDLKEAEMFAQAAINSISSHYRQSDRISIKSSINLIE